MSASRTTKLIKPEGALTDLNVNPCKMCMPMGTSQAVYGIRGCMEILHGSQGCATYIRRHMATHYNEPIDIASSALTEQGAVYGGKTNLFKGIDNLIRLYSPGVIAVCTTCMAETIGEDVPGLLNLWRVEHPESEVALIGVSSPGYAGTQFEGWFRFLHAIVSQVEAASAVSGGTSLPSPQRPLVNIVTGPMSPADMRWIKSLVGRFDLDAIFLPDISDNLDGARPEEYRRLSTSGTDIADVARMVQAQATIELATFIADDYSPAAYLYEQYHVAYKRLNLPVGLRDIDAFIAELARLSGDAIPEDLLAARGRYLDAMIDSHKYNAEGRAVIFGEPDFCYSVCRMCVEEGIVPVVVATGSKCRGFVEAIEPMVTELASAFLVDGYETIDDADFGDIERLAVKYGANIMIGSSDGRRIEAKCDIPLVRCEFPIHDHVGGQRVRMMGYEGSLMLLDAVTNSLLQRKTTTFRAAIRNEFYDNSELSAPRSLSVVPLIAKIPELHPGDDMASGAVVEIEHRAEAVELVPVEEKRVRTHPCFEDACPATARIHLPVAPLCNISCNYCLRRFDCANESRPGVVTKVLSPQEALERYISARERVESLDVVGIAGPGDALANWDQVRETLQLIREVDKDVLFCLSTNGLLLPRFADELIELGVTHVTVTMNAVDPVVGALVYRQVTLDHITYTGEAAAAVLLSNQIAGIKRLTSQGILVKVNCVLIEGVNDRHVDAVAQKAAELGAKMANIMPMIPVPGSPFGNRPLVKNSVVRSTRERCEQYLPQMRHCRQCRADAVGKLGEDIRALFDEKPEDKVASHHMEASDGEGSNRHVPKRVRKGSDTPLTQAHTKRLGKVAVASRGGMLVDQHFGHAKAFLIYETDGHDVHYCGRRMLKNYCSGADDCDESGHTDDAFGRVLGAIGDCDAVVSLRIGEAPQRMLRTSGVIPIATCDTVENAVREAYAEVCKERNVAQKALSLDASR